MFIIIRQFKYALNKYRGHTPYSSLCMTFKSSIKIMIPHQFKIIVIPLGNLKQEGKNLSNQTTQSRDHNFLFVPIVHPEKKKQVGLNVPDHRLHFVHCKRKGQVLKKNLSLIENPSNPDFSWQNQLPSYCIKHRIAKSQAPAHYRLPDLPLN